MDGCCESLKWVPESGISLWQRGCGVLCPCSWSAGRHRLTGHTSVPVTCAPPPPLPKDLLPYEPGKTLFSSVVCSLPHPSLALPGCVPPSSGGGRRPWVHQSLPTCDHQPSPFTPLPWTSPSPARWVRHSFHFLGLEIVLSTPLRTFRISFCGTLSV